MLGACGASGADRHGATPHNRLTFDLFHPTNKSFNLPTPSLSRALLPGLLNATFGNYTYHVLGIVETVKGILAFMVRWRKETNSAFYMQQNSTPQR